MCVCGEMLEDLADITVFVRAQVLAVSLCIAGNGHQLLPLAALRDEQLVLLYIHTYTHTYTHTHTHTHTHTYTHTHKQHTHLHTHNIVMKRLEMNDINETTKHIYVYTAQNFKVKYALWRRRRASLMPLLRSVAPSRSSRSSYTPNNQVINFRKESAKKGGKSVRTY